jgi:hypothetical protein
MRVETTGRGALPRLAAAFCAGALGCGRADVGAVPADPAAPGREAAGRVAAEGQAVSEGRPAMDEPYRRDAYGVPIGPATEGTTIVIGDVVLTMPRILNKVVGLVLLSDESKLGLVAAGGEGRTPTILCHLTREQVQQIRKDVQVGRKAEVTQSGGETAFVPVRLD